MTGVQWCEGPTCGRHGLSKENASRLSIRRRLRQKILDLIQGQATIDQLSWSAHGHVVPRFGLGR